MRHIGRIGRYGKSGCVSRCHRFVHEIREYARPVDGVLLSLVNRPRTGIRTRYPDTVSGHEIQVQYQFGQNGYQNRRQASLCVMYEVGACTSKPGAIVLTRKQV